MATPTMTMQLDMPAGAGAEGFVRLVASEEDNTVIAYATASDVAVAGERHVYASRSRTVTDATTILTDATLVSASAKFKASDVGRPISGTGIPANTTILSRTSATSVEMSANATAAGTNVTVQIDVDGLLTFEDMNPNSGASDDVIDDPVGTVWQLVVKYPTAPTPDPVYFTVPDSAGPHSILTYATTRPGSLAPGGGVLIPLDGDVSGPAGGNSLRPIVADQLTNQADLLPRHNAGLTDMDSQRVDVLIPADSMTQRWSYASSGAIYSWLELETIRLRALGPATCDWLPAGLVAFGAGVEYTTTGAAGTHGFGGQGITLDPGEFWTASLTGDAFAVYVTQQVSGGALCRVLVDGIEVSAPTTTTNAGLTIAGHFKQYESAAPLTDAAHVVRVEASGTGTVKLDGVLTHHGTLTAGMVLWNGGFSGSSAQTHLNQGGFTDAVKRLASTLATVILPSGLITYLGDTTGAAYIAGQQNAIDMVQANSDADIIIVHQYEPAGFVSLSTQWQNWGATTYPLARQLAEDEGCAFVSLWNPIGTVANQLPSTGNVDYFTLIAPLTTDYLHLNKRGQRQIADTIHPLLMQGRQSREKMATQAAVDGLSATYQPLNSALTTIAGLGASSLAARNSIAGAAPIRDYGQSRTTSTAELSVLASARVLAANTHIANDVTKQRGKVAIVNLTGGTITCRVRKYFGATVVADRTYSLTTFTGRTVILDEIETFENVSPSPVIHVDTNLQSGTNPSVGEDYWQMTATALTTATSADIAQDVTVQHSAATAGFVSELLTYTIDRESRY